MASSNPPTKPLNGRQQSIRLLITHLAACIVLVLGALLFRTLNLHLWPCAFYMFTGYSCLTCGATRATLALLELDLASSLLYNPLPLLLAAFMLTVMGFEVVGIIKNRRYPFRWLPHVIIGIVAILVIFCLLRNFGIIPPMPA